MPRGGWLGRLQTTRLLAQLRRPTSLTFRVYLNPGCDLPGSCVEPGSDRSEKPVSSGWVAESTEARGVEASWVPSFLPTFLSVCYEVSSIAAGGR
eukprot:3941128-Rhodomonas_salina.5